MRDLARGVRSSRNVNKIFGQLIVVLFIIGAVFFIKNNFVDTSVGGTSVVLREAPRGLKPVEVENGGVTDGGVDLAINRATLRDVKYGGTARASATRSYGGGIYILSVDATLPDPVNTQYQVWLVGSGAVLPIDYMRGSKTSWSLSLRDTDKYSKYSGIWITLERTKDEKPEEHVMEGSF